MFRIIGSDVIQFYVGRKNREGPSGRKLLPTWSQCLSLIFWPLALVRTKTGLPSVGGRTRTMRRLDGAFMVLLVIGAFSNKTVPPPTNMTVTCCNFSTTVQWEYSDQEPAAKFLVYVGGSARGYETTERQYDLSQLLWDSLENILDSHSVTVRAMQGGQMSENVSVSFTFSALKTTHVKCILELPPVALREEDSGAMVSFKNPLNYYKKLKQATGMSNAHFGFTVSVDVEAFQGHCHLETCKCEVTFPENVDKCITKMEGILKDSIGRYVKLQMTEDICLTESSQLQVMPLVVLLSVLLSVLVITLVFFIVYKVKAWTVTTPDLPPSLLASRRRQDLGVHVPSVRDLSALDVDVPPSAGLIAEKHTADDDSTNDSVNTECVSLGSVEDEGGGQARSPYDCSHTLELDIGDRDMVTVYTGKEVDSGR
ncbi:interferon gamma receptor 1 [Aulostomus maculatus]